MSPNEDHEILGPRKFEFGGVCIWPRLSVDHGIARLLGGLRCEGWKGLQMSPNEYCKSLGAR